jgi:hypothetical protein
MARSTSVASEVSSSNAWLPPGWRTARTTACRRPAVDGAPPEPGDPVLPPCPRHHPTGGAVRWPPVRPAIRTELGGPPQRRLSVAKAGLPTSHPPAHRFVVGTGGCRQDIVTSAGTGGGRSPPNACPASSTSRHRPPRRHRQPRRPGHPHRGDRPQAQPRGPLTEDHGCRVRHQRRVKSCRCRLSEGGEPADPFGFADHSNT